MMNHVIEDQFEFIDSLVIRHKPTGATISTYPYVDPKDTGSSVTGNAGRAGERLDNGDEYSLEKIVEVAVKLLRNRAMKQS